MATAASAIALSGLSVFRKGAAAFWHGWLDIGALMTVAVCGAFPIGQWPEAAMVMALYSLAELIEARAVERARNAIEGCWRCRRPRSRSGAADGSWTLRDAKEAAVGSIARVKPGERLALDGRVTTGRSAVDQSP